MNPDAVLRWFARGSVSISPPSAEPVAPAVESQKSPPEPAFEDLLPQDLELMRWYPVLNHEPKRIIWPADARSSINFDPARFHLNASSGELGLLSFGRAAAAGYRLRMDLYQTRWCGDVGLILGLRPNCDAPGGYRAQGLLFRMMHHQGHVHRFTLRRTQLIFAPGPDGDFSMDQLNTFDSIVTTPTGVPETFELEVLSTGMSYIRWIGAEVADLCTPEVNQAFKREDYSGEFGIFLLEADFTVSSVQLMPLKR